MAEEVEHPVGVKVEENTLPLIIRATEGNDSVDYLKKWIAQNKKWLEAKMLRHGRHYHAGYGWGLVLRLSR